MKADNLGLAHAQTALPIIAIPVALAALGLASAWLYNWSSDLHRFTQWIAAYIATYIAHFALYLAACHTALRFPRRLPRSVTLINLAIVMAFAVGFRAQLVDERPYLSTDVYRYIWDGHVQAAGVNPYRYIPSAPELAHLRENKIYPQINRGDYALTPYPPAAQAVFLAVYLAHPSSVAAFKIAMSLFDIISVLALMLVLARLDMDPARAIIFAWHPLVIWEGAHSGHLDSLLIALLALALLARSHRKPALTGIALALAALTKFYPALLLPAFMYSSEEASGDAAQPGREQAKMLSRLRTVIFNRANLWMMGAFVLTAVLAYLPYLSIGEGVFGYLPRELVEEGYVDNGSRYFLLALIRKVAPFPTMAFASLAALALIGAGLWWLLRNKRDATDVARGAVALIGLFLFLTAPRYPWYFTWLIPFLCFAPITGWFYLTGATVLLYLLWYTPYQYPNLPIWLGAAIYLPTLALLAWHYVRLRRSQGAARQGF